MRVTARLVSAIVAALLAVAAALALVELALAALGRTPWVVDWLSLETFGQEHSWDDAAVRLIALALIAGGIVLLVAALRPRPPVALDTGLGTDATVIRVRRHSLEALSAHAARSVDGVTAATARWTGRSLTVDVTTRRSVVAGIDGAVGQWADALLHDWRVDLEPTQVVVRSTSVQPGSVLPPPPSAPATPSSDAAADEAPIARWPVDEEGALR